MSSNTFPSTGGKPKFNPDAAYEAVQDTPAPKGGKPAFNPSKKFEAVHDTSQQSEQQPPEKIYVKDLKEGGSYISQDGNITTIKNGNAITHRQATDDDRKRIPMEADPFKPATDWLNVSQKGYHPMVQDNAVTIDDHTKNTAHSSSRVNEHLLNIDHSISNLIYSHKKDLTGRIKSTELGLNPKESGPVNQQAAVLESKMRQDIPVHAEEIEEYKKEMPTSPAKVRHALSQKAKDLARVDEAQANTLKGDIYRLDRQGSPEKEETIAKNIKKINEGEYDYDIVNGQLVKPESFFASVVTGFKEKGKAYDDYEVYRSGDEKKILDRINQRLLQDPDKAVPVPKEGWITEPLSEGGRMLGGLPIKPLVAGATAGYFSGGMASVAAASAVSSPEMYKLTFGSALPHNYEAIKKQNTNIPDTEVLQKAIDLTGEQANADALAGAAMGAIGARVALKPSTSLLLQRSVRSALKQIGETVAIEGLGGGAIGATGQYVKNVMAQKAGIPVDTSEGMAQQLVGGAFLTLGMTLAGKAGVLLKPSTYNRLLHGLSRVPEEAIAGELALAQEAGALTPEEAQRVQADIAEQKKVDASIRGDVPEADRVKVQQKIKERDAKKKELETAHEAYHPEIKEEIKKLDDDILAISKGSDRGELQKLIDKSKIDGAVKEYLKDLDEKGLKAAFKEISEQAHDPNSANQAVATFGEEIVNKAKELYPDRRGKSKLDIIEEDRAVELKAIDEKIEKAIKETHPASKEVEYLKRDRDDINKYYNNQISSLPKEVVSVGDPVTEATLKSKSISVVQPGELKRPETITIAPREQAAVSKSIVGEPVVTKVETGDLYEFESPLGKVAGVQTSPTEFRIDGISAHEVGKGHGSRLFEGLITYLKDKWIKTITTESAGEGAQRMHQKAVEKGLITEVSKDGRSATFTINESVKPKANEAATAIVAEESAMGEGVSHEPTEAGAPAQGTAAPDQVGGSIAPPMPPAEGARIHAERPDTQLSFRGLQETANEFGFEDVRPRDSKSDLQTRVNAERTANEWASKGEYQQNVDDMLGRIEDRKMVPTDEQRLILEQYLANEKQKIREIQKSSPEYDQQLQRLQRIKDIGQVARSEAGAALRLPDEGSRVHPINDEVDAMVAKMEANNVDKLTDQQKAEVAAQVEKYKNAADEANARAAAFAEQASKADAEKEFKKVRSSTKRVKKSAEERIAFRKSEVEAAREALKKLRTGESGLSSVPLPGLRELMAIAPHVKNIMVDLIAHGVDNLQDVVRQLHAEFNDVLDGITEKNIHDIIAGEYNEKTRPLSELQRQVKDIHDEAKLVNQLEALLNGKEPKAEKAKRERNQKIKELKDKIKGFKQEEREANKFHGESDAGERKLDKLRDELERIQDRKKKAPKDTPEEKEISKREQELRDQIKEAQAEWDKETEAGKMAQRDYARLEAERNRQLQKVADLKEKLDNLQNGVKSKGKAAANKTDTPEIEALKKQIDNAQKELNKTTATEKRIKGLEHELDRLRQRKEKEPKETNSRDVTDRERDLKEQIDAERKDIRAEEAEANKFYKEELDDDAKKLIAIKKRNQKREQEIKEKIAKGQFEKETKTSIFDREDLKKTHPRLRKDALDAIVKKEEAQHEFDLALFNDEMKQRKWYQKAGSLGAKLIHTSKAIMSGIDDSATFVQNGLAMLANPKVGVKVWLEHWKDAFSKERFKRELAALHERPDWGIIKNSGLDIVEPHSAASKQVEEAFEQNLLANLKIKGVKPWDYTGGVFERAFTSMGNNMRLALFEKQMAALIDAGKTYESHPKEFKDAARVINELTGRGKLPAAIAQASPYITPFVWAPRMLTSTINTLGFGEIMALGGKGYYQNLTPMQRKFALSQLGRGIGIGVGVMGAAALGGAQVDYDPRSVTFGDVIMGDHHYNVFGRYTPVVKAIVQFTMGERVKKDGVQDLDSGKRGAKTRMGVVGGFFRGKMTPAAGAAYDLAEGKNYFTNKEFGVKDLPGALLQPMSVKELREGWQNDGTWTILNRFLPAFEGMKVSDERDFNKKEESKPKSSHSSGRTTKRTNPHQKH